MKKTSARNSPPITDTGKAQPHRIRLPGFVSDDDIGLGDALRRATTYLGIKPCGGCERRAAALNRWLIFSRRQSR